MSLTHSRARVAALSRFRPPDHPELIDAKQTLRTEKIALYIDRVVSEAPPLTIEQRNRIADLLRGGRGA